MTASSSAPPGPLGGGAWSLPRGDAIRRQVERELAVRLSLDRLTPGWGLLQRVDGHRHSIDDLATAWYALEAGLEPRRYLDLGAGIGGVGLLVLYALPPSSRAWYVEAQSESFHLLRANVALNGVEARVELHHADLRALRLPHRFDLVTGSPPYFPVGTGVLPADPQKAHARFELRGDVGDYAHAAAAALSDGGAFVYCFPSAQRARALRAATAAGLTVRRVREVVPRQGRAPLFTLLEARRAPAPLVEEPPLVVRDAAGAQTAEYHAVRARFGWPAPGSAGPA